MWKAHGVCCDFLIQQREKGNYWEIQSLRLPAISFPLCLNVVLNRISHYPMTESNSSVSSLFRLRVPPQIHWLIETKYCVHHGWGTHPTVDCELYKMIRADAQSARASGLNGEPLFAAYLKDVDA